MCYYIPCKISCLKICRAQKRIVVLCICWHSFCLKVKGKVLYSLLSVGPGADSARRWLSHPPGGRLPLLSAGPTVTFPAEEHHCPSASTKLYCLVTQVYGCEQLAQGCYWQCSGFDSISQPLSHQSDALSTRLSSRLLENCEMDQVVGDSGSVCWWCCRGQVNESERERLESELEHMKVAQRLNDAEQRVKKLQRDWKRNIAKSRQIFLFIILCVFVVSHLCYGECHFKFYNCTHTHTAIIASYISYMLLCLVVVLPWTHVCR